MKFLFVALGLYALLCAGMYFAQRKLMYFPDPVRPLAAASGLPRARDTDVRTADGETLAAWEIMPADETRPVYLYLHGNAGTVAMRAERFKLMTANGEGLLALDWRGYGGSTGTPDEAGLHQDARTGYNYLRAKFHANRIVLFGESLGSGPALKLASEHPAGAVILDSPYFSTLDIAMNSYWWLPVRFLLRDTYRSDLWIKNVSAPLLILHGEKDKVIPITQGEKLFAQAREPKQFFRMPQAEHVSAYLHGAGSEVAGFLARNLKQ